MAQPTTPIEHSVANARRAIAAAGLRRALSQLRNCCVCVIADPNHVEARRELGQILLSDLHEAFDPGTLPRAYIEEVRVLGENLAMRLEPDKANRRRVREAAVRLSQAVDVLVEYIERKAIDDNAWCSSDEAFQKLVHGLILGPLQHGASGLSH